MRKLRPQRPAFLSRMGCADKRALLLGAAFSSMLAAGALYPSAPAQAQTQIETASQQNTFTDVDVLVGTGAPIDETKSNTVSQSNSDTETITYNGVISPLPTASPNFFQYIDVYQSNSITIGYIVTNTYDINDTDDGINILIETDAEQRNEADLSITNDADVDVTGYSFEQRVDLDQSNTIDVYITIDNSGDISGPPDYGIRADIENDDIDQENYAEIDITNNGDVDAASFTQRAGAEDNPVTQSNSVVNLIDIENSGDLTADPDDGLYAEIFNDEIDQDNNLDADIDNYGNIGDDADITGSFLQIVDAEQTNAVVNDIVISNTGDINAADDGIYAQIHNDDINSDNEADIEIDNLNDVDADGGFTQAANLAQTNLIDNELRIDTAGALTGFENGIEADIENDFDGETRNRAEIGISNEDSVEAASFTQTANVDQTNTIDSVLVIVNRGDVTAQDTNDFNDAIDAEIDNDYADFRNTLLISDEYEGEIIATGEVEATAFSQLVDAAQLNNVDNFISIETSGALASPEGYGVRAEITNDEFRFVNGAGEDGDPIRIVNEDEIDANSFEQIFTGVQTNQVANLAVIENSGGVDAPGYDAINAEIDNDDLEFYNTIVVEIVNDGDVDGPGDYDALSFTQIAGGDQFNAIYNEIEIGNEGKLSAEEDSIRGDIYNLDIDGVNYAYLDVSNTYDVDADAFTQFGGALQENVLYNSIEIDNDAILITEMESGIDPDINNRDVDFDNEESIFITNDPVEGDVDTYAFLQNAAVLQSSVVANAIVVDNGADIGGAPDNAIDPEIYNYNIFFDNEADIVISSEEDVDADGGSFTQSIAIDESALAAAPDGALSGLAGAPAGLVQENGLFNYIGVFNSGDADASDDSDSYGIYAEIDNENVGFQNYADIAIRNESDVVTGVFLQTADIQQTNGVYSGVFIENSGDFTVSSPGDAAGIEVDISNFDIELDNDLDAGDEADFLISNEGDVEADSVTQSAFADQLNIVDNAVGIENSGDLNSSDDGMHIEIDNFELSLENEAEVFILNTDGVTSDSFKQRATVDQENKILSDIAISNSGDIDAVEDGILAEIDNIDLSLENDADIDLINEDGVTSDSFNQRATVDQENKLRSEIAISNSGDIAAAYDGIDASIDNYNLSFSNDSDIALINDAGVASGSFNQTATVDQENRLFSEIVISNSGDISAAQDGIRAEIDVYNISMANISSITQNDSTGSANQTASVDQSNVIDNRIEISNSGDIDAGYAGIYASIQTGSYDAADVQSHVVIDNSGSVTGGTYGVYSYTDSYGSDTSASTTIVNSGFITADNLFAIQVNGGVASVDNSGVVLGYANLTDNDDTFTNSGTFEARLTSDFGDGDDVFTNEEGGTVDTADDPSVDEDVRFVELERFENFGTISLVDGAPGDLFTIADTLGGTGLDYIAGSTLAVDAFLGSPNTGRSDIFRIDGDVSGKTDVVVNVTGTEDAANAKGITVVQVRGSVDEDAFRLRDGPIETGFFVFDLFFEEDGAAFDEFELRSFAGPGAFLLPQLVTAAQDIWHETSDTWFDRSADLRSFFFAQPYTAAPVYTGGKDLGGVVAVPPPTGGPAVWARGSGAWIDRDETVRTEAFGRDFTFNLDNELHVADFQAGVDIHRRGVLSPGDVLLLTAFGGAVWADLDFDKIARRFDYEGGQAGAAVTYLNGGLFVDALFNAQFLEIEPEAFGFGPDFDADTYGFRVDSGYRFGLRSIFLEPLLTISYAESDLDGFTVGPNRVSFGDEHSLRGRIGLRAGTVWDLWGVRAEPYVIASLWSELDDDDNRAQLTSSGTTFNFEDENEDTWGEVSFGSHYYLFGSNAVSAFTKTDIAFGDDYEAYAFKGGFRVNW